MPAGLGGTITGTVRAASSGEPVGRILVDALRPDATGALQIAASGATQADGSYQLAGLFPTDYVLRFSADGFDPTWYPGAPDQTGAAAVPATVDAVTTGKDVVITGKPGSITGTVDPGDALAPVVTTVTVRATQGATAGQDVATTTTDGVNAYSIPEPAGAGGLRTELRRARLPAQRGEHLGGRRRGPDPADRAAQRVQRIDHRDRHRRHQLRWAGPPSAPPSTAPR